MTSSEERPTNSQPELLAPAPTGDDAGWQQAHWAFIVIGGLRNLRGWVIPLAILMVTRGFRGTREDVVWYGLAAAATVFSVGASLIEWWNYRYRVSDRDITLKSGVISRQERVIPFERIQSVNLTDAPLERFFQVTRVSVETGAGGGADSEIELQAVRVNEAATLRARLIAARQHAHSERVGDVQESAAGPIADLPSNGTLVRKISTKELLIAGATSGRVGAAAAIAGALLQFGDELMPRSWWDQIPWAGVENAARDISIVTTVIIVLGLIAWLISIVVTVLMYGGFELRREGDQLHIQHGLLDRRRSTIPINRIQAIRVTDGILQQPFGYAEVRFHSAGFGDDQQASGVLSPMLPASEVPAFVAAACPEFAMDVDPSALQRLPRRALQRYVVAAASGWVIFVVAVALIVWRFTGYPAWWAPTALVLTPLFAWLGVVRYRDAGWYVGNGDFLLRWRSVSRVTILTKVRRLQYRELTANPFQRRVGLATFRTAVASGASREGFSLPHLDAQDAERLVQQLGGRQSRPRQTAPRTQPAPQADAHPGTV